MRFDVYFPFTNKAGARCPGIRPYPMTWNEICFYITNDEHVGHVKAVREATNKDDKTKAKKECAAVTFCGHTEKTRSSANCTLTGLVMIDIDHCNRDPREAWKEIAQRLGTEWGKQYCLLSHVTVSGNGLRVIFIAQPGLKTLKENMEWFCDKVTADEFGDFDRGVYNADRMSFLPLKEDIIFTNGFLMSEDGFPHFETDLLAFQQNEDGAAPNGMLFSDAETIDNFTDEEKEKFEAYEYRGTLIKTIIAKWVEVNGKPGEGEVHNYYNEMVKYFRNIVSNNKRALLYLLPRFGHDAAECWSQIQSITRVSTLSQLPRAFYFFLKDNGFYKTRYGNGGTLAEYMMSEGNDVPEEKMPWLPPVFREYIRITPKDFRASVVNSLLPILGTLTSYLGAKYYFDERVHTTSFFSVIYAPPGTGKGFVERMMDLLFEKLRVRDYVQNARETIYLNELNRKGDNERKPIDPNTSQRLMPVKNSESEFLSKQKDNNGYHMFTYAAEMDSWAKGVKSAGGNKDDMIRIAWDNGEYGQAFKSASTFKGSVKLYWNVLITGTVQQLFMYFKNVENGLITRCSFTSIDNQEYASAPIWKQLKPKEVALIRKFMERCDKNTYQDPCTVLIEDVDTVKPDEFDKEIDWHFKFRPRQIVDMAWLRPCIEGFLERHLKKAALDLDKARDVFRRRAAVRGFRLGLICYALWEHPRKSDLEKCIPFIEWWMDQDLESSLKLWGSRYNAETQETPNLYNRSIYSQLGQCFSKEDVYALCVKQGINSPVRNVIYQWRKMGYVVEIEKGKYEKKQGK